MPEMPHSLSASGTPDNSIGASAFPRQSQHIRDSPKISIKAFPHPLFSFSLFFFDFFSFFYTGESGHDPWLKARSFN